MTGYNRPASFLRIAAAAIMVLVFAAFGILHTRPSRPSAPLNPYSLPTDAVPTDPNCVISPGTFNGWFQSGTASVSGVVNPANSLAFPNIPNCSFYQWAEQQFLWLTSPAYGSSGPLFETANFFFDVSPQDPITGNRTFIPHSPGFIPAIAMSATRVGPHNLPTVFDRSGTMLQYKPAGRGTQPLVRDLSGQVVQIAHARLGKDGRPILLDRSGKAIQAQSSQEVEKQKAPISEMITAQRFIVDGIWIFVDPGLAIIDVEQGQADNSVLEAQALSGGSLVYYITTVNDVYAYTLTGVKNGAISATQFPTTQPQLTSVTNYALPVTISDPNALAVMVKTAWVVAAGLPNLSNYITTTATTPTYGPKTPTTWFANGQQTTQLALVGMHVVGSTAGHPEMLWATWEHFANMPRATYTYNNSSGTQTVTQDTNASWVFTTTNSSGPFNCEHMLFAAPNVDAISPAPPLPCPQSPTISPSDTIRWKAFGAASDGAPNPIAVDPTTGLPSTAASNTEVIAINNSVNGMAAFSGDVRNNYVLTGATWTALGNAPTGVFQLGGNEVGTSVLSNATIETYVQGTDTTLANGGANCFSCHTPSPDFLHVSHDFQNLLPLFPATPSFQVLANPGIVTVGQSGSAATMITIVPRSGFTGNVTLSASGLPSGVTATFSPNPASSTSTMTLTANAVAAPGTVTVQITGTSGTLTSTTTMSLTVVTQGLTLSALPNSLTVLQSSSGTSTITIEPVNGFSGNVTLAASGLPSGVTAAFSPNPATSTSTLTLTASPTANPGTVTVAITGTSGSLTGTTYITVTVPANTPTLPQWAAIIMAIGLISFSVWRIHRSRTSQRPRRA